METSFTKIFAPFYLNTRVKLEFFYSLIISDLDYKAYKNTRFFPTGGGMFNFETLPPEYT